MGMMWIMVAYNGAVLFFLYRFINNANKNKYSEKETLDILKRRYANGELSTASTKNEKKTLEAS
jgi:uncharacterized membrane protein